MASVGGLPTGIVTFVFTDIESSTRLMRRVGDRYPELSERHMELLRDAWAAHDGCEVGTAGDSMFVAFQDATDAVRACADAQRRMSAETWPDDGEVKVRIGVHSGLAVPRGDNYTALAVNQAARVMSVAHGGQVLVSEQTADLVPGPGSVGLVAVGRYRVRDFDHPVRLFALSSEDGAATPAVRAVPADGHNLVAPATPLIGRQNEVDDVAAMIRPGRSLTLVGPGGVGKTRMAIEVGRTVALHWPDGVWMVDLAPLPDASLIGSAMSTAIGAPPRSGDRWIDVLEHLEDREALVVLDNCEHLLPACGSAIDELLQTCERCAVVATSREPLGIERETRHRVPPLDGDAAAMLFAERAKAAGSPVVVDGTVEEICRSLDGLPLAIELAAARLGAVQPIDLLEGLNDRFRLLRTRRSTVPERHRTMEALLEWSERLLDPDERACLRRLGVFGGSFTMHAATAAADAADIDVYDVPELLWSLVDKSLVVADPVANETRYRLLESVRAFCCRRMEDAGELGWTAERMATWYLELVGPARRFSPGWIGAVGADIDNLRALIPLLASEWQELAQQLAYVIARYHDRLQSYRAAIDELSSHIELLSQPTRIRISLFTTLGDLHLRLGNVEAAQRAVEAAEALHEAVGDPPEWDDVTIERTRGEIASRSGDNASAIAAAQRALAGHLSPRGQARMWSQLGIAAHELADLDLAREAFQHEYDLYRELKDEFFESAAAGNLAEVEMRRGDHEAAARHQRKSLELGLGLGAPVAVAFSIIVAARLAAAGHDWPMAATLHGHAEVLLESTGIALYDADRRVTDAMVKEAREHLGDGAFERARRAGAELALLDAAALADSVLAAVANE